MKRVFTALFFLLSISAGFSQTFPVDTLYKHGPMGNRINVVILGDGFTEAELPKFKTEAKKFADFFLSYAPYDRYKGYFNFFSIPTPSNESGVTNPGTAPDAYVDQPVGKKDTFYKGTFGTNIHRLVTVDYTIVLNVLAANLPEYDLAVVLENTEFYGGSGGSISVHTLHDLANLIGVHEIGHTFSHLNDEYWAGPEYGWEAPNMTANNNPSTIKWRNWLNSNGISIYKHGTDAAASKWFKPTDGACLMELLNQQFCAVCKEATVETMLSVVNPVEKTVPDTDGIVRIDGPKTFMLNLVKPDPNTLHVDWKLNDKPFASGPDQVSLSQDDMEDYATLTATVFDSTALSRRDDAPQMRSWKFEWNLESASPKIFKIRSTADSICTGEQVTLTASGCTGTVQWSSGETTNAITFRPDKTSNYGATCKITGKADSTISKTITVLPLPPATASNTGPYFEGSTIEVSAKGGVTYNWTGPANFSSDNQTALVPAATVANRGIYEAKVTDMYGCIARATTTVMVDPILAVDQEPNGWLQVSPNPSKDFVKVATTLPGESMFTIYDLSGRKVLVKSFSIQAQFKLNAAPGIYPYRFENGEKKISGKLLVQ